MTNRLRCSQYQRGLARPVAAHCTFPFGAAAADLSSAVASPFQNTAARTNPVHCVAVIIYRFLPALTLYN